MRSNSSAGKALIDAAATQPGEFPVEDEDEKTGKDVLVCRTLSRRVKPNAAGSKAEKCRLAREGVVLLDREMGRCIHTYY